VQSKHFYPNTCGTEVCILLPKYILPTSQYTPLSTVQTSQLMLYGEIITVYSVNHMKHKSTVWRGLLMLKCVEYIQGPAEIPDDLVTQL